MFEIKAPFRLQWLEKIAQFVEKSATELGCHHRSTLFDLKLAVDEASTNLIRHSRSTQKKNHFLIRIKKAKPELLQVEIIDYGQPFEFHKYELPNLRHTLPHGFGIGLLKAVTQDATYHAKDGKNVLTFFKPITKEAYANPRKESP